MAIDDDIPTRTPTDSVTVSNIKKEIPIILNREKGQYSNWVELFEIHCHPCNVLDHIDPINPRPDIHEATWKRSIRL